MEIIDFRELKRQTLTRRTDKLIEWLNRPEYVDYTSGDSTVQLIKVIDLIIWALERSIPMYQWKVFLKDLMDARRNIVDTFETEEIEKENYMRTRRQVINTLTSYGEFIQK